MTHPWPCVSSWKARCSNPRYSKCSRSPGAPCLAHRPASPKLISARIVRSETPILAHYGPPSSSSSAFASAKSGASKPSVNQS